MYISEAPTTKKIYKCYNNGPTGSRSESKQIQNIIRSITFRIHCTVKQAHTKGGIYCSLNKHRSMEQRDSISRITDLCCSADQSDRFKYRDLSMDITIEQNRDGNHEIMDGTGGHHEQLIRTVCTTSIRI